MFASGAPGLPKPSGPGSFPVEPAAIREIPDDGCAHAVTGFWESEMEFTTIAYEKIGRIAVITLNRPDKFNTIRPPMPDEVDKAIEAATRDADVRVIFLQGAGKSFCAGFDFSGGLEHHKEYGFHDADGEYDIEIGRAHV
jgi:1,4-dihydroxy-2-naphthoyl-CoA synthase